MFLRLYLQVEAKFILVFEVKFKVLVILPVNYAYDLRI